MERLYDIDVLAELEALQIEYQERSEGELVLVCPFHSDRSPSLFLNANAGMFVCQASSCKATGTFVELYAKLTNQHVADVLAEFSTRYDLADDKVVQASVIEEAYNLLKSSGTAKFIEALEHRGITAELRRQYRIGEHNGHVTIPIKSDAGLYINIRYYTPGAPGNLKYQNMRGRGNPPRWFPIEQLSYPDIVICGGELKAILAATQLNSFEIGAAALTAGEGAWEPRWAKRFKGKKVFICFDVDEAGKASAERLAKILYFIADEVYIIELPLDTEKYPKGDMNDFIAQENGNIYKLVLEARRNGPWQPAAVAPVKEVSPVEIDLVHTVHAENTNKRMLWTAVVSSKDASPYALPKRVKVDCDRDQKMCALCPVMQAREFEISPESQVLIGLLGCNDTKLEIRVREAIGVPRTCRVARLETLQHYTVEDTRVSSEIGLDSLNTERQLLPAYVVSNGHFQDCELNAVYQMEGRMHPHPDTQQSSLIVSKIHATRDVLSSYTADVTGLEIFRPEAPTIEALRKKLHEVYADLEANCTHIYKRRIMHLVMDLVWHSPLAMTFDGRRQKAWLEGIIVGDTELGKSETGTALLQHYGLGERVICKNATRAGLLGGMQQASGRFWTTWGVIPSNDRRLVLLDEFNGLSLETIASMTDMRSSGVAELQMIEKRRARARTRWLALANPRNERSVASFNFGAQALKDVVGAPQDIRRFDIAMIVRQGEIKVEELTQLMISRPEVPHRFTRDLCRKLILWSWTHEGATFTPEATQLILTGSAKLSQRYIEKIPLISTGDARNKIARLSAAVAARTFAENMVVQEHHVQFILELVQMIYDSPAFGLLACTEAERRATEIERPEVVKKALEKLHFAAQFARELQATSIFDREDLQNWGSLPADQASHLLSLLIRHRCVQRRGKGYVKVEAFMAFLRDFKPPEVPSHIAEDF